jgi:hypothetical protein
MLQIQASRAIKPVCVLVALLTANAAWAFDANGVKLGDREKDVRRAFQSAHCKALEWESRAADRRCDDAKVAIAGTTVRATFYIKNDIVQAFDLRFHSRDAEQMAKHLKTRWGEPVSESNDGSSEKGGRKVYKVLWEAGRDRAVLVSQSQSRRASVLASRGNFDEEIYRLSPDKR